MEADRREAENTAADLEFWPALKQERVQRKVDTAAVKLALAWHCVLDWAPNRDSFS